MYTNIDPKFSDRQFWANSVEADQAEQSNQVFTLFVVLSYLFGCISFR